MNQTDPQDLEPQSPEPAEEGEPAEVAPEQPEAAAELDDGEELEETIGTTEVGRACSEAMVSLSRAARSFLLYDPENKAIRLFLEDLREKLRSFVGRYGDMVLTVRPWEMLLGNEVVYVNRDRERSLSFRLFRDGVRKVTIGKGVAWDELTKFLGIISIRYTGVRQQEDDIVTLLWKAGFRNITIVAVEGFVPEDDDWTETRAGASEGEEGEQGVFYQGPRVFDLPLPQLRERGPLRYTPIEPERLTELAEEVTNITLPDHTVRLLREILEAAANPADPLSLEEARPTIEEVRDFLLSEGLLKHLLEVMRVLRTLSFSPKERELLDKIVGGFSDVRALGRVIRSVPTGLRELPSDLLELVRMVPGDRVTILTEILAEERSSSSRWAVRTLLVELAADSVDYLVELIETLDGPVTGDLLLVVSELDMEAAFQVAMAVDSDAVRELQLTALVIIERNPYSREVAQKLTFFLDSPHVEVRMRAIKLLVTQRERWAFMALTQRLEQYHSSGMDSEEIEAVAAAMASIWHTRALDQFKRWIKPKGLFQKIIPGQGNLKRAAVYGLSQIPAKDSMKYIRLFMKESSGELQAYAGECLARLSRTMVEDGDA